MDFDFTRVNPNHDNERFNNEFPETTFDPGIHCDVFHNDATSFHDIIDTTGHNSIPPGGPYTGLHVEASTNDHSMLSDDILSEIKIHDQVEHMRQEFGLHALDVQLVPGFQNAAQSPEENQYMSYDDKIFYDSDFIVQMAQEHGEGVVTGIIGHEVGHSLVKPGTPPHEHEYTADLVSGMISARNGCSPDAMEHFFISPEVRGESESHPHGFFRLSKFREGYKLAHDNPEVPLADLLNQTSVANNINQSDLIFDSIASKYHHNSTHDDINNNIDITDNSEPKEVFHGKSDGEISFKGGIGYCGIKCLHESDDRGTNIPSSDWSAELG